LIYIEILQLSLGIQLSLYTNQHLSVARLP